MSAVNDFLVELMRAANETDRINRFEKMRLLDRAVTTIQDMRETIGIPASSASSDAVIDLQTVAALMDAGEASDATVKTALLEAAAMIRDLHIVLDTKTEIQFGKKGS